MNKKGLFNVVEIIVYLFFILVLSVFIYIAAFSYINEKIETTNLETFLLFKKLTYSDSCLAYNNDLRVHTGIIDLEKFNSPRLNICFTKKDFGYFIKLASKTGDLIKTASNLDDRQEAYLPVCKTVKQYKCTSKTDPILYYNKGEIKQGFLTLEVIKLVG